MEITYGNVTGKHIWMVVYKAFYDLQTKPRTLFGSIKFSIREFYEAFDLSQNFFASIDVSKQKYFNNYLEFLAKEDNYFDYLLYLIGNHAILVSNYKMVDSNISKMECV